MLCPGCRRELTDAGPARLDQSGMTYLPARRLRCDECAKIGQEWIVVVKTGEPYEVYPVAKLP